MDWSIPQLNLVLAWAWVLLGFVSGMTLGLGFHREGWLGGYGSLRRRLYRLGHISFFGLALINLMFYFTARIPSEMGLLARAGHLFVIGAIAMPCCCLVMAHYPKARLLFAIPVISLIGGAALTLWEVAKL
jgi:hypothetical protein